MKALEDVRRDASGRVLCVDFGPPASSRMPVFAVSRPPSVDSEGFVQARRPAPMMLGHFFERPQKAVQKKRGSRFRPLTACEAGRCDESCGHDVSDHEDVDCADGSSKPFVIDNSNFPVVADARPILKGKSKSHQVKC